MSKVQRYDDGGYNGYGVTEDDDGEYVLYSDYADLKRQRDELVAAIEDAIAGLQTMVGLDAVTIEAMLEEAIAQAEKDDE